MLASVQGLLTNVTALIAVPFLVGVVEAAVLPAMVIFLSHWFTKGERGRANTFLMRPAPPTPTRSERRGQDSARNRRSRRLLRDDEHRARAIAAPAIIGLSSPAAASGSAATL